MNVLCQFPFKHMGVLFMKVKLLSSAIGDATDDLIQIYVMVNSDVRMDLVYRILFSVMAQLTVGTPRTRERHVV